MKMNYPLLLAYSSIKVLDNNIGVGPASKLIFPGKITEYPINAFV